MNSAWSRQVSARSVSRSSLVAMMVIIALISQSIGVAGAASVGSNRQPMELPPARSAAVGDPNLIFSSAHSHSSGAQPIAVPQAIGVPAPNAIVVPSTTITVSLLGTTYATHDSNSNADPSVWVVEAVLTNTGSITATTPKVVLDMNSNASWYLLAGEAPTRTLASIAPNATQVLYWFAHRSNTIPDPHTYTVTVSAENVETVTQHLNAFANPAGQTVETRSSLNTGNNGIFNAAATVRVGAAFTVTVGYGLGSNPSGITLQPVGNLNFTPDAYSLQRNTVQFGNATGPLGPLYRDRTYFPPGTVPSGATVVTGTYTFVALQAANTTLCPYTDVHYNTQDKYDNNFCRGVNQVNITGTLTISMSKFVSASTVEQGQLLTYTMRYTNTGNLPLGNVYLWDTLPAQTTAVTASPAPDPTRGFNTTDRVVWNIGNVAASGNPGSTGVVTLTVLVDGRGSDLPNGTSLINDGYLGILFNPDAVKPAITSTVTTTVLAPTIAISKSDNQTNVVQGQLLTYTLAVTNSASTAATNVVITDVLPTGLTYSGGASPAPSGIAGQTLTWTVASLAGNSVYGLSLPVSVDYQLANGTILSNSMQVRYSNSLGAHTYLEQSISDVDVVQAPVLNITKTSAPNPALIGRVLTYTLDATNAGPAAATNVIITDVVPISTTYLSCSGAACGLDSGNVVSWTLPSFAAGASAILTMSVQLTTNLTSGAAIANQTYGILSTQTLYVAGAPQTTVVRAVSAKVIGRAFVDTNVNGQLDAGETGIPNVAVILPEAVQPNTTTDANGYYTFTVEQEVPISVSADLPAGYYRTTTNPVYLSATLETTTTLNFGYNSTSSNTGAIIGVVYQDLNHNGVQDSGENGLSGVSVASSPGATTSPVTTNSFGQYTLGFTSAGTYTVTETNPASFVSTTPDAVTQVLALHASETINFGDFLGIRVDGMVFDDLNVNGTFDAEPGLGGAVLSIRSDTYTTTASGLYTLFAAVHTGEPLTLTETDPVGYVSTAAIPGDARVIPIDVNTLQVSSPTSGATYLNNNFGDAQATGVVSITGQIFDDVNADGLRNEVGTPGLRYGRITASTGMFITTTSTGDFTLYVPPGTVVTVTETNPDGYVSTNAIPGNNAVKYDLDTIRVGPLATGTSSDGNYFGDVVLSNAAIITGVLFNDANNNGLFDSSEGVFPGEIVQLSGTVSLITTTVSNGTYQFAVGASDFLVTSAVPAGYYRTTPAVIALTTTLATTYPNRNFGFSNNAGVANIYGTVFNDYNGDGFQQLGELPLAGALITLTFNTTVIATATTGINGAYSFGVSVPGVYMVKEKNPPGYFSTSPDQLNQLVALGNSYPLNFGDSNHTDVGSVHGLVYVDANASGVQDSGEVGLAGALITTTADNGVVISVTTGAQGQYSYGFDSVSSGFHTINEEDPPGYRSTTPNQVPVYVLPGFAEVVDFGDCQVGSCSSVVTGIVFNDTNSNGTQDITELGISDVTVTLYNGSTFITSTVTRANGDYTFGVDTGLIYRVVETDPPFYHSTTPNEVHVSIVTTDTYGVNFGDSNLNNASVFGTVYNDTNANATFDPTEAGIANVTVAITGSFSGNPILSLKTNSYGQYTFLIDQAGLFTVTETDLPGYVSTTPNVVTQTVVLGNGYDTDFGDYAGGSGNPGGIRIDGKVFNDLDANLIDNGEPGIAGVTITVSSGVGDFTDGSGHFAVFAPSNVGPITVTETNLSGYVSTVAIAGSGASVIDINRLRINAPLSGTTYTGNEFGDSSGSVKIEGVVFHDANANGLDDDGQMLAGAVIQASGGTSMTTGITGTFTVYAPSNAGPITITEIDPAGYVSTGAIAGNAATVMDSDHLVITSPISGLHSINNKFGNYFGVRVLGSIFSDRNVNAQWDIAYEPVITATSVTLAGSGGLTASTGSSGVYTLYAQVIAGFVSVTETVPVSYTTTTPTSLLFAGTPGQQYTNKNFGLLPPSCGADAYEALSDDFYNTAGVTLTPGIQQRHNFHRYDDKDWAKVNLQKDNRYTFTTVAFGARADTVLQLYAPDGVTLLSSNDDLGSADFSSQINWTAQLSGQYYLRVTQHDATQAGCDTNYSLEMSVAPRHTLYLPLIAKNFP